MKEMLEYINRKSNYFLIILLGSNFFFRLLIYYKTTLFSFTDYSGYLNAIELIKTNGSMPLIGSGNYLYFNSYIGYFFKYILGNLDYYFIFNCLLGTITSYIIYLICKKLTKNKVVGLSAIFLHIVYLEFMTFSSIFYTPIIMMFILSIIILLLIHYIDASGYKKFLLIIAILLLVNVTYYFKGELSNLWMLLILFGLINFRNKKVIVGFILLGVLLTFSTRALRNYHVLPYVAGHIGHNNFVFFGHTLYGGDGGDGAFIYEENKKRYDKALAEYCRVNNITIPTRIDKNNFQREEIRKFIKDHPLKWIKLQFYKFFRFFGVVPDSNSYMVLVSGIFKGRKIFTAFVLVLPFALMILLLIITFNFKSIKDKINKPELLLMGFLLLYYITASVFYGQYQERYRMPVMVCFLIPLLSWLLINFKIKDLMSRKIELYLKLAAVVLIIGIWSSQTYNALVVHKERYLRTTVDISGKNGPEELK